MSTVIIGAHGGIGSKFAEHYVGRGQVILQQRLKSEARYAHLASPGLKYVFGDFCSDSTQHQILEFIDDGDTVDMLILAAGVYTQSLTAVQASPMEAEIHMELAKASMKFVLRLLPYMCTESWIINLNSISAKNYCPNEAIYSAGKAALASFFKNIRAACLKDGVRVLDVFLGGVDTPMTANRPGHELMMDPKEVAEAIIHLPLGMKTLQIEEITLGRTRH